MMLWGNAEAYWNRVLPERSSRSFRGTSVADFCHSFIKNYLFSCARLNVDEVKRGAVTAYQSVFQLFSGDRFTGDDKVLHGISEKLRIAVDQQIEERQKHNLHVDSEVLEVEVQDVHRRAYIYGDLSPLAEDSSWLELYCGNVLYYLFRAPMQYVPEHGTSLNSLSLGQRANLFAKVVVPALQSTNTKVVFEHDVRLKTCERYALYGPSKTLIAGTADLLKDQVRVIRLHTNPLPMAALDHTKVYHRVIGVRAGPVEYHSSQLV
mmetsp:Transcript_23151/g.38095  ORF Transcript_23151/g.38095 Transcript_23151/m.38095 type:complete len:264 (+) Transcript_23151:214-1005(+)